MVKKVKVTRKGNAMSVLNGSEFIVYEMTDATFRQIANKVTLDLRPNGEYLTIWGWNTDVLQQGTLPDPFTGSTGWYSVNVSASQSWGGAGNSIYSGTDGEYATQASAVMSAYESAVKGHESEWDLVLVMRNPEQSAVPNAQLVGFGEANQVFWASTPSSGGNDIDHAMDIPSDGDWHIYTINCAELGGFHLSLDDNGTASLFNRVISGVGVCDVCAAFLVKK